jgi:uncharacterized protein with PQ loop repeat
MMTITEIAGFAGAGLAGAAYVPQISHLIRARCAAGISRLAFAVWLLASVLVTVRAVAVGAGVFIALGGIQIVATALIMFYAARYKDMPCPSHFPRPPRTRTLMGNYPVTARPGREAGAQAFRSWPKFRIAAPAPYATLAGPPSSQPCAGFQTTHQGGTT